LLRKGRFDEVFFVDLPTRTERVSIWRLHLAKRLAFPALSGEIQLDAEFVDELAAMSEGMSGAEIEQTLVAALFDAYSERRPLRKDDIFRALASVVPLSVTQAEKIEAIRAWANRRAVTATAAEDWDLDRPTGGSAGQGTGRNPGRPEG
jgi:SpoVK/Ycf46/Vps4 family AAA+-type ATPase